MINPTEFENLSLIEKGITLLDKGNLINTRSEDNCKVFLFELKGNLIEVYIHQSKKNIEKIKVLSFEESKTLKEKELYFA